jgi:hypothetical protein
MPEALEGLKRRGAEWYFEPQRHRGRRGCLRHWRGLKRRGAEGYFEPQRHKDTEDALGMESY